MSHLAVKSIFAAALFAAASVAQAQCPTFANASVPRGGSNTSIGQVSNLAFAQYFVQASQVSGGSANLINLGITALPGFTTSNGQKGFTGTGSTLYVTYAVPLAATPGSFRDVNVRIFNVLGQTVCSSNFRVTVL